MKRILIIFIIIIIGCEDETGNINCENLSIRLSELEYADCGGSNGTLTISVSGGTEPYLYKINDGTPQSSNQFTDLDPQYYSVIVEDANGCTDSVRTFIGGVQAVKAIALITPAGCGTSNGSLEIRAKNGIEPYRYQLGEIDDYTYDNTFTGLSAGRYSVWVKDDRDCFLGIYPVVLNGVSSEDVMPFLTQNCAKSGCHDSTTKPDLSQMSPSKILEIARLQNHHGSQLETNQLDQLVCWIEDLNLRGG